MRTADRMKNVLAWILASGGIFISIPNRANSQWVPTAGPEGGSVYDLAVSGEAVFAAVSGYGVYRSMDSGRTWESVSPVLPERVQVFDLAAFGGKVYACHQVSQYNAEEETRFGKIPPGVVVTLDNGRNWQSAKRSMPGDGGVRFLKARGGALFAGTDDGRLYASASTGDRWQTIDGGRRFDVESLAANDGCVVVAATTSYKLEASDVKVFVTEDHGISWKDANSGLPPNCDVRCLEIYGSTLFAGLDGWDYGQERWDPVRKEKVFVRYPEPRRKGLGLYRSADSGASWQPTNSGLPPNPFVTSLISRGRELFAGVYGEGVYRSTDDGRSWTAVSSGLPKGIWITCLADDGKSLYASTYWYGVFVSRNGGENWAPANSGLAHTDVRALAARQDNIFAGTTGFNFSSTDGGLSYRAVGTVLPAGSVTCLLTAGRDTVAGTREGVFLSRNGGEDWVPINSGLPEEREISCLAAAGELLYAAIDDRVFRASPEDAQWTETHPFRSAPPRAYVQALLAAGTKIFAATSEGLFWSADQGEEWRPAGAGAPPGGFFCSLARRGSEIFAGTRSGEIFAGTRSVGLYRSSDGGLHWQIAVAGLPKGADGQILLAAGSDLFAVTDKGFFRLGTREAVWRSLDKGLPRGVEIQCLVENGERILAGTADHGVWQLPLSPTRTR